MEKGLRDKILKTKLEVSNKANKLIYFGMKHPLRIVLKLIQTILLTYDRKTN
jgi:hypothetical protein